MSSIPEQKQMDEDTAIRIGGYYERPDGSIVQILRGQDIPEKDVLYTFYTGSGPTMFTAEESRVRTWKYRPDLNDYPNCDDPRLPYTFDLFWDIKRHSDLRRALESEPASTVAKIREAMVDHNITLAPEPEKRARKKARPG